MSNTKTVMSQAANTQGIPLDITDVFSTYLYEGTSSNQTITNGIDLAGEGGLIWTKQRNIDPNNHMLVDTERGLNKWLVSNTTNAEGTHQNITSVSSTGYVIPSNTNAINNDAYNFTSWTFRKAPKFFDVVTYTGNGASQNISHNLGCVPGMIIVKNTSASANWAVWHRGNTSPEYQHLQINTTSAALTSATVWNSTNPTDTVFSVGNYYNTNNSGSTYVAYLFAHNNGDGEFGPDGSDIIKCGSYTGNGSSNGPEIDLGFEPQWVLIKESSNTGNWQLFDNMRGMVADGVDARIAPNLSSAEDSIQSLTPTATGFKINTTSGNMNTNGSDHIYMAIRRGPLSPPESATEVFDVNTLIGNGTSGRAISTGFVTDFHLSMRRTSNYPTIVDRLRGHGEGATKRLATHLNNAEQSLTGSYWLGLDTNDGYVLSAGYENGNSQSYVQYALSRAPNFFDVVAYTGAYGGLTINHNLGVVPEMMWVKARTGPNNVDWAVYHKDLDTDEYLFLNQNVATQGPRTIIWSDTRPTDSVFYAGGTTQDPYTSSNNYTYIAYLFASLPGISKVGSYTGNGTSQTIDCGFTSGARFVLIKCTTIGYDWQVFDTERGIVAGNDSKLALNTTQAEQTNGDFIDPSSSGFAVTSSSSMNANGETFIFYAIA